MFLDYAGGGILLPVPSFGVVYGYLLAVTATLVRVIRDALK